MKLYEDYMKIEFQVVYDFMLNRLADKAVQAGIFYLTNPQEQTLLLDFVGLVTVIGFLSLNP